MNFNTTQYAVIEAVTQTTQALQNEFVNNIMPSIVEESENHLTKIREMGLPIEREHLESIKEIARTTYEDWLVGALTSGV